MKFVPCYKFKYNEKFLCIYYLFFYVSIISSPFKGQIQQFKQPDGSMVDVRLFGNEFYMRAEGLDEYTLIRDKATGGFGLLRRFR